jgi:ABC-2 type transport system ATP-binding protein
VLSLVASLRGRVTVLFSSHILADVQRVADRVGVLRAGRLIYQGSTRALVEEHLQPRWRMRLVGDPGPVLEKLRQEPWALHVEAVEDGLLVEASTLEDGERGLPAVVASTGARLASLEPVAADLETAFLALTGHAR